VETLGCTTVICSDKTGTLTLNEMTAVSMVHMGKKVGDIVELDVTGTSYNPAGEVTGLDPKLKSQGCVDFAAICTLCNDSKIQYSEEDAKYVRTGEPTEAALKVLAEKMGVPGQGSKTDTSCTAVSDHFKAKYERKALLEFSRGRKSMGVIVKPKNGGDNVLMVKGAPESIVERCTRVRLQDGSTAAMSSALRDKLMKLSEDMASRPLRVLAVAMKEELRELANYDGPKHKAHKLLTVNPDEFKEIENYMVFVGFIGIKDPARPEVAPAIETCKEAGIRVIMITGDQRRTAEAIAREIGIFTADEDVSLKSFDGKEFAGFSTEKQKELLRGHTGRAFSRTDPTDKQLIVNLLKEMGEIPAMTGDGVNDAPALKAASIGIAMGIAGTEVAKEASDMVLADDNFATIVSAVEEGRSIYSNMKAFIRYLISSNIGEVASIFLTALLGIPEGLIPVQLLWVNLVTDGPPATALGFNIPDKDIMRHKPRRANDDLITGWVFFRYMIIGLYVGFATVGIFVYWYLVDFAGDGHSTVTWGQLTNWGKCSTWDDFQVNGYENPCDIFTHGKVKASTLSLSVLVAIEMFNALNALSEDGSLLTIPPWTNPYLLLAMAFSFAAHCLILYIPVLATIFEIAPLSLEEWKVVIYFSAPVVIVDELLKVIGRIRFEKLRRDEAAVAKKLEQEKKEQ